MTKEENYLLQTYKSLYNTKAYFYGQYYTWRLTFLLTFNAPYTKIATMHFTFDQESCFITFISFI